MCIVFAKWHQLPTSQSCRSNIFISLHTPRTPTVRRHGSSDESGTTERNRKLEMKKLFPLFAIRCARFLRQLFYVRVVCLRQVALSKTNRKSTQNSDADMRNRRSHLACFVCIYLCSRCASSLALHPNLIQLFVCSVCLQPFHLRQPQIQRRAYIVFLFGTNL